MQHSLTLHAVDQRSFNAVNELRRLARWMRMPCCTNQSSVPKAGHFLQNGAKVLAL